MPEPDRKPPDFRVAVLWVAGVLIVAFLLLFGSCDQPLDIEQPKPAASATR